MKQFIQIFLFTFLLLANTRLLPAQRPYWQQRVEYTMDVDLDADANQFKGTQQLIYYNNSPDTLVKVFYHLYFNAFQPGSMMDVRSRTISDPDIRVGSRIHSLKEEEKGYLKVRSLRQDGQVSGFETSGTILEVTLPHAIPPGGKTALSMEFEGQVPVQIRRSGRDNGEGVRFSMSQWYPKLCEYDERGWHSNPYIGREFYGVWGDFDVTLHVDPEYTVAASGILQNPGEMGHGYGKTGQKDKKTGNEKLIWHFKAQNVHDFVWTADPDYQHVIYSTRNGPDLHFFYRPDANVKSWEECMPYIEKAFAYMTEHLGPYPYKQYSVIQAGDGGMEYPMATFVTGKRELPSLTGVIIHELIHSWFYGILGSNESLYAWMDEGFTTYATTVVSDFVWGRTPEANPFSPRYDSYFQAVEDGVEEPLNTHSDHFQTNQAYHTAAYDKGAVFLHQLSYVIGQKALDRSFLRYYDAWKFKHPNPNDFIRIAEMVSGLELDWYLDYFAGTTHTIDYGIKTLIERKGKTYLSLERIGNMPMPVEIFVEYRDGHQQTYYLPLDLMRGEKPNESPDRPWLVNPDWPWTQPTYTLVLPESASGISRITLDPSLRMADIDRSNNTLEMDVFGGEGK